MREWARREATVSSVVVLVAFAVIADTRCAQAQQETAPARAAPQKQFFPVRQMPLTEKLIQGFIAAANEVDETTDSAEEDIDKLRPETIAKLDGIVKRYGLASYDQYRQIGENVGLVNSGLDEVTGRYVGREALIKLRIARVKADTKMPAISKQEKLRDLSGDLQFALPQVQYKSNIDLVVRYSKKLDAVMRGD